MEFEFVSRQDLNFIAELARQLGCRCENDILRFPKEFGEGYIRILEPEKGLKLVVHRHKLKEQLIFKRNSSTTKNNFITITFNTVDRPAVFLQDTTAREGINLSSVYITSTDMGLTTYFPPDKNIHSTIIVIHLTMLHKFLKTTTENKVLDAIISGHSFWYDTNMTPDIRNILMQMGDDLDNKHFGRLFYSIKVQQLIYQLFAELIDKENRPQHSLKPSDIEKMYEIRDTITSTLNKPPSLYSLARGVGMSETKMKAIFRQIFGKSIYNYYQIARMEEAAKLLKHMSVKEAGYKLGILNPSYFSQLFEKYHKIKPKKFKDQNY